MVKNERYLEKIIKGFSNHRRISIVQLLERRPEQSVIEITEELRVNFRTASDHLRRLLNAGLIIKRYEGSFVRHALTPLGHSILKFLRTLE